MPRRRMVRATVFATVSGDEARTIAMGLPMFAYLDAGSGSMILGAVAAGAAGVGVAARSALSKFKKKGKADESTEQVEANEPEPETAAD